MIRIGLLGASRIAPLAVLAPAAQRDDVFVSCVAASDPERASAYAAEHGIDVVASDYASLIASDKVDLVYNALPPNVHARWSIAALRAGKHVLCEKPFAMNAVEAQQMVDVAVATGNVLIEAFHYRFHPLFRRVLAIVRSGEIGAVRKMHSHLNVPIPWREGELRYDPALGGGAMMDLGCYPVHWVRTVANTEPRVASAKALWHRGGADIATDVQLEFKNDVVAHIGASMSEELPGGLDARLQIVGDDGQLEVVNPLAPHLGHELILESYNVSRSEQIEGQTTYDHQLAHVVDVLNGTAVTLTGGSDAISNMRVLDEIYRRAR